MNKALTMTPEQCVVFNDLYNQKREADRLIKQMTMSDEEMAQLAKGNYWQQFIQLKILAKGLTVIEAELAAFNATLSSEEMADVIQFLLEQTND